MKGQLLLLWAFVMVLSACGRSSTTIDDSRHESHAVATVERTDLALVSKQGLMSSTNRSQEFECLLGRPTWFGTLRVELRVTGLFDESQRLGRVRISRLPGGPFRYDVVKQSNIDPTSASMFSLELVHEDNAGYYEAFVTVSNKQFSGPTDGFTVESVSPEYLFEAKYVWRDLHQNESSGIGACYLNR